MNDLVTSDGGTPHSVPRQRERSQILILDRRGNAMLTILVNLGVDPKIGVLWDKIAKCCERFTIPQETFRTLVDEIGCGSLPVLEVLYERVREFRPDDDDPYRDLRRKYPIVFTVSTPRNVVEKALSLRMAASRGSEPAQNGIKAASKTGQFSEVFRVIDGMPWAEFYAIWFGYGMPMLPDDINVKPAPVPKKRSPRAEDQSLQETKDGD